MFFKKFPKFHHSPYYQFCPYPRKGPHKISRPPQRKFLESVTASEMGLQNLGFAKKTTSESKRLWIISNVA